jgi:hypothetical protein
MVRGAFAHRHSTGTGPPGNTLPANTAVPTVSGTPAQGNTLTAIPGTWTGTPTPTLTDQWERNGADIASATGLTYVVAANDVGASIRIRETATNSVGSVSAWSTAVAIPSPQLFNTAAGGTNAVTVTTGNSGGPGDTAWDAVSIGTGGALVYDNTAANVSSGLGYKFTMGGTVAPLTLTWSTALSAIPATGRLTGRFYYVAASTGPNQRLLQVTSGATLLCALNHIAATGVGVRFADTGGTGRGVGQGLTLATNTLYRFEFDVSGIGAGSGAGSSSLACYFGNTNTLVAPVDTVTGINYGALPYDTVAFGAVTGGVASTSFWMDGFLLNATGVLPGPEIVSGLLTPKSPGDLTPSATGTLTPVDVTTQTLLTPKNPGDLTPTTTGTLTPVSVTTLALLTPKSPGDLTPLSPGTLVPL